MPTCHWNWQRKPQSHNRQTLLLLLEEVLTMCLWSGRRAKRDSHRGMTDGCTRSEKSYENRWEREECGREETPYIEQVWKPLRQ